MTDRKTLTVASNAPMAIQIHSVDPNADPAKPGLLDPQHVTVIHGHRHHSAVNGMGLTHNVDAETFDQWMAAHPEHKDVLIPMTPEELDAHLNLAQHYGYEPALAAMANDPEQAKLAAQGSTDVEQPAPSPAPAAPAPQPNAAAEPVAAQPAPEA
jgi:hypothetical protein